MPFWALSLILGSKAAANCLDNPNGCPFEGDLRGGVPGEYQGAYAASCRLGAHGLRAGTTGKPKGVAYSHRCSEREV